MFGRSGDRVVKSALLTKAALCICPPAIVATTAATVPPVRRAVHRFTSAHEPQHHYKPAAAPCVPLDHSTFASMLPASGIDSPVDLPQPSGYTAITPGPGTPGVPIGPQLLNPTPLFPIGPGLLPGPGGTTPDTPAVPEPGVWLTMVVGFGMIGAGFRQRRRYVVRSRKLAMAGGVGSDQGGKGLASGMGLGGAAVTGTLLMPAALSPLHAGTKIAQLGSKAMHSSLLAKAALCVCPPVAMAIGTAAVPPVRHAVYNATAPSIPKAPAGGGVSAQGAPCVPVDVPTAAEAVRGAGDKLAVLKYTPGWPS